MREAMSDDRRTMMFRVRGATSSHKAMAGFLSAFIEFKNEEIGGFFWGLSWSAFGVGRWKISVKTPQCRLFYMAVPWYAGIIDAAFFFKLSTSRHGDIGTFPGGFMDSFAGKEDSIRCTAKRRANP